LGSFIAGGQYYDSNSAIGLENASFLGFLPRNTAYLLKIVAIQAENYNHGSYRVSG
jgi:hypothetical protein